MPMSPVELDSMPPIAALAAILADLAPELVDDDGELLDVIAGWDRVIAWANARQLAAMAEFARRPWVIGPEPDTESAKAAVRAARGRPGQWLREFAEDEIAARLAVSTAAAGARVGLGCALAGPLSATGAALSAGVIDVPKARSIADGCRFLEPGTAAEVQARVLPGAGGQTNARVKQAIRRAVIHADPVAAEQRCVRAAAERGVWLTPQDDGVAELRAVLPAADAVTIYEVLTAAGRAAKVTGADARTMGQLRADFLLAPFRAALMSNELAGIAPPKLAVHRGTRGQLQLTVPASVILGISNGPGELAGYGPITAEVARTLAGECTWRRVITDPIDGRMLAMDTDAYRPPAALARHVQVRDQTCRFVGCALPARRCHLDHSQAHPRGRTCHDNLGPLCGHHHLFKHALDAAFAHLRQRCLTQPEPGVFTWTMPTGHRYTKNPPAIAPPIAEQVTTEKDDCPF